jgi:hypothetical protein
MEAITNPERFADSLEGFSGRLSRELQHTARSELIFKENSTVTKRVALLLFHPVVSARPH